MADTEWELHRPELERLYIQERKTLPKIMEYMSSKHAFEERKSQYEKWFKKWGLRKNHALTESEGKFIARRVEKRKREDHKESEVYIHGVQYAPSKMKKLQYNKAFLSTVDRLPTAPSPDTPEGIDVCTPASPGIRHDWNNSFPWFRFSKFLIPGQISNLPSPSSVLTVASPRLSSALTNSTNQVIMQRLGSIIPWKKLSHPPNITSLSRMTAGLRILMPEEFIDQHHTIAARLCNNQQITMESIGLELYLLSNNLVSHGAKGKSEDSMDRHDKRVMELFRMSGWNNKKHIEALVSSQEPTAEAIVEKLFASALRLCDSKTVELILAAGMDPNSRVDTFHHGPLTCLQLAASTKAQKGIEIIELLLSHRADINLSFNRYPALHYAVQNCEEEVIQLLLSHGAISTPFVLADATGSLSVNLFRQILDRTTDVNIHRHWKRRSALASAVMLENIPMIELLLARGADINSQSRLDTGRFTTVLGFAVQMKNLEIIKVLLQACTNVNPRFNNNYVSPLALAVETGDVGIVQLLLQAGVNVETADEDQDLTMLERALRRRDLKMGQFLIAHGFGMHKPQSDKLQPSSPLLVAVQNDIHVMTYLLIQAGVPLNELYKMDPGTVLAAAIEKGDLRLLHTLISSGASFIGPKLQSIGNLATAMYLQQVGALQYISDTCGARALASAIWAENNDLAQWLLDHNVGVAREITNIEISESSEMHLVAAIATGNHSFVEALLTRGIQVTDYDIVEAAEYRDTRILQRLLTSFRGAAPNALGYAILHENMDLIKLLLDAGVTPTGPPELSEDMWHDDRKVDSYVGNQTSILETAALTGHKSILRILLQSYSWDERLVGRALAVAVVFHHTELIDEILEFTVDVNQDACIIYKQSYDEYGQTKEWWEENLSPLQAAVKYQDAPLTQRLLNLSATKIDYVGEYSRTALQHAVENGNMELVNLLLDHGADVNIAPAKLRGATALQIAAIQGYLGIARKLIELGADINAPRAECGGRTALEGAAEHGRIDMLQMLFDEGASLLGDGIGKQYGRAVELAENNGHNAAAKLLKSFKNRLEESPETGQRGSV